MLNKAVKTLSLSLSLVLAAGSAQATLVDYYDTIANGQAQFTNTVTGAGGSVSSETLTGLSGGSSWSLTDFTITTTDGGSEGVYGTGQNNSTGQMIGMNPADLDGSGTGVGSGLTFTFNSAINALGFEVGDWATCCFPSELFISFDGGAVVKVASANDAMDNPAYAAGGSRGDSFFIGAIDDSSTFTTVTFYGNGFGEFLTAGGTVMYSSIAVGALPVTEPSTLAILALSLIGFSASRRNKAK